MWTIIYITAGITVLYYLLKAAYNVGWNTRDEQLASRPTAMDLIATMANRQMHDITIDAVQRMTETVLRRRRPDNGTGSNA